MYMTWQAVSLGARVPCRGEGQVHSVFRRAVHLALARGGWLALLWDELPDVAHAIRISCGCANLHDWFAPGAAFEWRRDALSIDSRRGAVVSVRIRGAPVWRSPLRAGTGEPEHLARIARDTWCAALPSMASRSIFWGAVRSAALSPLAQAVRSRLSALRTACKERRPQAVAASAKRLVGLGPGLTPAGDDLLIGWLAGAALLIPDPAREEMAAVLRRAIRVCLSETTDVSRAHLEDALDGQFSERLSRFANALSAACTGREPEVQDALCALAGFGASSGLDAAAGLLAALDTWGAGDCAFQSPSCAQSGGQEGEWHA